jgi:hypothetical protein
MSLLVLQGQYANTLERLAGLVGNVGLAGGVPIVASDADANFPVLNLTDGILHHPFRWGSGAVDPLLTIDLNLVMNGGFESGAVGALPAGWGTSVGTSFQINTTNKNDGANSARLGASGDGGFQGLTMRSGERATISWAIRGDGSAQAQLQVLNIHTNKALNSSGAWAAAGTNLDTQTTAAFKTGSRTFTVEDFATTRRDTCTILIICRQSGAGNTWYDSLYVWPETDFAAVFGHNWPPSVAPELRHDTAAFAGAGTQVAGAFATVYQPSMYASFSTISSRYIRIKLTGTPPPGEIPWIGKLVVGQKQTFARHHNYGDRRELDDSGQVRGSGRAFLTTDRGRRVWSPTWTLSSDAEYTSFKEYMERSRHGAYPGVLVPYDAGPGDTNVCLYGRWAEPRFAFTHQFLTMRPTEGQVFVEDPYPTWAQ